MLTLMLFWYVISYIRWSIYRLLYLILFQGDDDPGYDSIYLHDQVKQEKDDNKGHDVVETTDNPYYGGSDYTEGIVQKSDNLYYDDVELEPKESTVKTDQNPYYDGDPTENSTTPHSIKTSNNPYYDDGSGQYVDTDPNTTAERKIKAGEVENVTNSENPYYSKE